MATYKGVMSSIIATDMPAHECPARAEVEYTRETTPFTLLLEEPSDDGYAHAHGFLVSATLQKEDRDVITARVHAGLLAPFEGDPDVYACADCEAAGITCTCAGWGGLEMAILPSEAAEVQAHLVAANNRRS